MSLYQDMRRITLLTIDMYNWAENLLIELNEKDSSYILFIYFLKLYVAMVSFNRKINTTKLLIYFMNIIHSNTLSIY